MGDVSRVHPGLDLPLYIGNPVIIIISIFLRKVFPRGVVFEIEEETKTLKSAMAVGELGFAVN